MLLIRPLSLIKQCFIIIILLLGLAFAYDPDNYWYTQLLFLLILLLLLILLFINKYYNNANRVEIIQRDGVRMLNEGKE